MKIGREPAAAGENAEIHLRIMVEEAVHSGKSERD